ncbi:MAG: FkbM family methyltransferase [Saprospiraceae bacterium]|nr:FkbM family methyltransferase [Saprospiraceae bacterium]
MSWKKKVKAIANAVGLGDVLDKTVARLKGHGPKDELLFSFFTLLKTLDFQPKHIVDVGANHGTWTREVLKYFPDAYYTLLEPQAHMEHSIHDILNKNPKVTFHAVGAGKEAGAFQFTIVDRDDSCTFGMSAEEAQQRGFQQIKVPVVTLNDLLNNPKLPTPDIIKIDAEGLDMEVLQGASHFFGKTEVFMVEASIGNRDFKNTFSTVLNFMEARGYRLFDITDLNRPFDPKVLWLTELVFIKNDGWIDKKNSEAKSLL